MSGICCTGKLNKVTAVSSGLIVNDTILSEELDRQMWTSSESPSRLESNAKLGIKAMRDSPALKVHSSLSNALPNWRVAWRLFEARSCSFVRKTYKAFNSYIEDSSDEMPHSITSIVKMKHFISAIVWIDDCTQCCVIHWPSNSDSMCRWCSGIECDDENTCPVHIVSSMTDNSLSQCPNKAERWAKCAAWFDMVS